MTKPTRVWPADNKHQGVMSLPRNKGNTIDLFLASTTINILSLALPITLMQVYDRILPNQSMGTLYWLVIGCSVALFLEAMIRVSRSFISAWMAARFEHLVGCHALERLLKSRLEDFEKKGTGVHLDRLKAVTVLRGFYSGQVFQILLDLPFALLFIAAIWFLAKELALFTIAVICLFSLLVWFAKIGFEKSRKLQHEINNRRFSFIIELLGGIHSTKALALEEQMLRRYERLQKGTAEANIKASFWSMLPVNLATMFSNIAMFGVILLGGGLVLEGSLTIGGLAACTMLTGRAMQPVQSITGFWLRFSDAKIARSQLQAIEEMPSDMVSGLPLFPEEIEGRLDLRNISFRYREDTPYVLKDLSLQVPAGQMVGLTGSSSSGSTTLLYLLMGILKPEKGLVLFDNYNIHEWDRSKRTGELEYLPQVGDLFKGTILENIAMFDPVNFDVAMDAAAIVGLDDLAATLPMGYETPVDVQSKNLLPSGLIQRISIARALVVRPRILLLDKTNAAMDKETEKAFQWLLEHLKGTCTIILVSDQSHLLSLADITYELSDGTLKEKKSGRKNR